MSAHRIPSQKPRSPGTVRQKPSAVLAIPRQPRVNTGVNSLRYTLASVAKAGESWAAANYGLGLRIGQRGTAPTVLIRREAVAANRFREALAGARAVLRAFAGGGA